MRVNKNKLALAMARQCMTTADVIEKAEMPKSTFIKVLAGKEVFPATAGKVARALGVDVTEIIELEDFQ